MPHDKPIAANPTDAPKSALRARRWWCWPLAVAAIGAIVTGLATRAVAERMEIEANNEFERLVDHVASETQRRMSLPVIALHGLRALYAAHPEVGLPGFRAFVASHDLEREFPGVRGFGLVDRVRPGEAAHYALSVRAEGRPDFGVTSPEGGSEMFVVRYLEPAAGNAAAPGRNLGSEPNLRLAIESAILDDQATLATRSPMEPGSARSIDMAAGQMLFLPVYHGGTTPDNDDDRWRQLRGLVYAPINFAAALAGVERVADHRLDFEVFDGPATTRANLLYELAGQHDDLGAGVVPADADRRFVSTRALTIGNRAITLQARTTARFDAGFDRSLTRITALSGSALTLLAAFAAWLLAAGGARVARQVALLTADLDRLAKVARFTSNAVIVTDASRRITWVNEGFTRISGWTAEEVIGRSPGQLLQCEGTDRQMIERLREKLAAGQAFRGELFNRARDGREYWVDIEIQPLHRPDGGLEGFMAIESDVTERRQAADSLAHERARLAHILDGTNAGDAEWNLCTGALVVSPRWAAMFGFSLAELDPVSIETWVSLCHRGDLRRFVRSVRRHVRGQTAQIDVEVRMRHRAGHWLSIDVRGRISSHRADGRPEWVSGTHIDVTQQRHDTRRWQSRAELSSDWFWQTDPSHRVLDLGAFERLRDLGHDGVGRLRDAVGWRRDEMPWAGPPEGQSSWAPFHAMLDRHEAFKGVAYRVETDDGRSRWVEIEGRPHYDDSGVFLGYEGVGRDITERRRATDELRASLALIDALFEGIPVPVVMKDTDCRYQRMNRAYAALFGLNAADIIGKSATDVIDSAAAARHDREDRTLLAVPGSCTYEVHQTLAGGRQLDALVCKSTLLAHDGRVLGLVGTMVDISEQKAAQRALAEAKDAAEAANHAKSAFLATMSHEIRTPMNGVLGMAELLAHSRLDDEQSQSVHTIHASATALLRLIDDILDFSKIEAGRLDLEAEAVELTPLVEGVCDALTPMAADKQVSLQVFVAPDAPERILADPVRLRQLLINLAGNAIKFSAGRSETPGRVSVRVWPDAEGLRIEVRDNGIGMDDAALARLFRPFTQGEVSTTRRFGGTGLGLAICKRLVEMMDGRIEVASRSGEGASFSVWLPVQALASEPAMARYDLDGLDCLIVDDGTLPAADLAAWLAHAGAAVQLHADAGQALAATATLRPPVLLIQAERADGRNVLPDPPGVDLRHLLIGRGRRSAARLVAPNAATLDQLRRAPLLRAVAALAGRASPETVAPRGPELVSPSLRPAPTTAQARKRGQLILVAEDDSTNKMVIRRQLALLGYAAEVVDDGEQALQAWRAGGHALLLTDLHMPALDGYSLARQIRADEAAGIADTDSGGSRAARLPILALTANALKGEAARARAAGMDDYLTKPVPLKVLQASLQRWMPPARLPMQEVDTSSAVDLDVLREMVGDDPQALHELLVEYLRSAREQVAALREAWLTGDHRHAGAIAHKLKSASRAIGARTLGDLCAGLEQQRLGGDASTSAVDIAHFERSFAAVVSHIEARIGEFAT